MINDYNIFSSCYAILFFSVTAASNDSDNVAKSFLQLKLCLDNGDKIKNIFTEMTIGQFYKFLHDLENAKCNLDLLL